MRLFCVRNPLEQFHETRFRSRPSGDAKRMRCVMKAPRLVRAHSGRVASEK